MKKFIPALGVLLLAFPASASSSLFVSSTGNVGVGTTSPAYNLDVLGSTTSSAARLTSNSTDSTNLFLNNTTTGGQNWYVGTVGSANPASENPGSFHIGLNGTGTFLGITTSGEVVVPNDESILGNLTVSGIATLGNGSTAVTQTAGDNSTKIATTAYVDNATGGGTAIKSVYVQTFTSSGTYTPTTGMTYAVVEMVGGGGGSAGNGGNTGAPGGGSGGYLKALLTAAQIGASQTVTIGTGGSAGTSTPTDGGDGGTTSLGTLLSSTGGDGSTFTTTGGSCFNQGGSGGTATVTTGTALITMTGGQGDSGGQSFYTVGGWGMGGHGGGSPLGTGGSSVYTGSGATTSTHISGNSGTGYGAGAGGPVDQSATAIAGTAGQPGIVIITEYCTQ